MTANTREEHLYMAKIAEQTERFEDMLDSMKKAVSANADLTVE
jgi:14-3-3 protein epsilon